MANPKNLEGQGFHTDPDRINKDGRPKGSRNLSTILEKLLNEDIDYTDEQGVKSRKQFQEVIIRKLLKKANDGELRAIIEIFDRVEGKATVEIKGKIETTARVVAYMPEKKQS